MVDNIADRGDFGDGAGLNTTRIDELIGLKGKLSESEGAYKVTSPRDDVPVTVDGWPLPGFMGMTTSAFFMNGSPSEAILLAELTLFENEVKSPHVRGAGKRAQITFVHNHFFFDYARAFFV